MEDKFEIILKDFIGIFPNVLNEKTCQAYNKWFDIISENGLTMSSIKDTKGMSSNTQRNDEVIHIPTGLAKADSIICATAFPSALMTKLWENMHTCINIYNIEYNIEQPITSHSFKLHRVKPSGGYHVWHHEHSFQDRHRILAWMLIIEAPKRGGETEFLLQSMRVEPKVGQLLIWPAYFTHKHRGNPPLEGQKTYMTGWFEIQDHRTVTGR